MRAQDPCEGWTERSCRTSGVDSDRRDDVVCECGKHHLRTGILPFKSAYQVGESMKISARGYALFLFAFAAVLASPVLAQNGCVNSPENPTALLALVGSAGGVLVAMRNRLRRR